MRIFKGQINLDGLSLAQLQTMQANLQTAYNNRLAGNGVNQQATEEITIAGLDMKAVKLEELLNQIGEVANAIQKKLPGSTFTQAAFGGGDCWRNGWGGFYGPWC